MAEKTLNTRIKLKYDSQANWNSSTLVLLAGEVAICEIPATVSGGQPSIGIKVGNGSKKFSELPWIEATAGDVYAWAKAASKPSYSANEISGLADYISGKVQDTNTKYKLELAGGTLTLSKKDISDSDYTSQNSFTLPVDTLTTGTANGTVSFNGTDVPVKGLDSAAYTKSSAYYSATAGTNLNTTVTNHTNNKNNPHAVNKVQVGLGNVTNNAQVKGLGSGTTENHIVTWGTDGYTVKDSGYTIATSVPANAKFTDTTYSTGTATVAGLTKLYTSSGSATDGTMTQAAIRSAIDSTLTAAMEFKGAAAALPTSSTNGSMYKVTGNITVNATTDAEGKGFTAKVGDTLVYKDAKWYLIPSGDDIEDTWRKITAGGTAIGNDVNLTLNGATGVSVSGNANGTVSIGHTNSVTAASNVGATKDLTIDQTAKSGSITIPKLSYDAQGHITATGTQTLNITVPAAETFKSVVVSAGGGLTGGATISTSGGSATISHAAKPATTATADSTVGSATERTYVKQIKLDSYGHIIDVVTGAETVKNTDTGITAVNANNGLSRSISGRTLTLGITSISTDLLTQGTNTLIFDCGSAS